MRHVMLAISLILFGQIAAFPQVFPEEENLDVVYLTDGSVLRGKIIENFKERYVTIEIFGGSVFTVGYGGIESITEEPNPDYNTRWIKVHIDDRDTPIADSDPDAGTPPDVADTDEDSRNGNVPLVPDHLASGALVTLSAGMGQVSIEGNDWQEAMDAVNAEDPRSGPMFHIGGRFSRLRQISPTRRPWWFWGVRSGVGYSRHRLDYVIDDPAGSGYSSDYNFITDVLELPIELMIGGGGRRLLGFAGGGLGVSYLIGEPTSWFKGGEAPEIKDMGHPSGNDPERRFQIYASLIAGVYIRLGERWTGTIGANWIRQLGEGWYPGFSQQYVKAGPFIGIGYHVK